MKQLCFETKRNHTKAPRIYVKCAKSKKVFGSFLADNTGMFDGWEHLNEHATVELKLYMQNINTISKMFGNQALDDPEDYRFKLPKSLHNAIYDVCLIDNDIDIYTPMVASVLQSLRVAIKNNPDKKEELQNVLEAHGIAAYSKNDFTSVIKAIFTELNNVHNKSEKLHKLALRVFNKDKSFSPLTLDKMASLEIKPSKWLVACAIIILFG